MSERLENRPDQQDLSHLLAALEPELLSFLRKSGVGIKESRRYQKSLSSLLQLMREKKLEYAALYTESLRRTFLAVDAKRRAPHLRKLLLFFDYIDLARRLGHPAGSGITLEESLSEFLNYLAARRYSNTTLEHYRRVVSDFHALCFEADVVSVGNLSKRSVEKYLNHIFIREKDRYCLNKKIHVLYELKNYLRYLLESGHTLVDLGSYIEVPKQEKKALRNIFKREEIVKIFQAINSNTIFGFMDRVLFELLYDTGIRINELCGIRVGDVDQAKRTLLIREGKGGRERLLPLVRTARQYLEAYLEDVRPRIVRKIQERYAVTSQDYLFLSIYGKRLAGHNMSASLQRYMESAGISFKRTSHAFRYSFATHLLENGADIRYISDLLGHTNPDTTGGYLCASKKALLSSLAFHPRAEAGPELLEEIRFKGRGGKA